MTSEPSKPSNLKNKPLRPVEYVSNDVLDRLYRPVFETFMLIDFKGAVDASTKASYNGSWYVLELFQDGYYRILWEKDVGNLYESPGMIIRVPSLVVEEEDNGWYDRAERGIRESFSSNLSLLSQG
jgi:hypothetical protein